MFIPTRHNDEKTQDGSLHKAFVACPAFLGKDNSSLLQLFPDNLHELHDMLFGIDAEAINAPENSYTAISDATEVARDSNTTELNSLHILYLFEFFKIIKIGGLNIPYASIE
jgi:hypothetical protein